MILQRLVEYYDRISSDPAQPKELATVGFSRENISFCLVIAKNGSVDLQDLRQEGKKGPSAAKMEVPHYGEKRTVNERPYFLWDSTEYVFGHGAEPCKSARSSRRFELFKRLHLDLQRSVGHPDFDGVCKFLETWNPAQCATLPNWEEARGKNIVFKIAGQHRYIHELTNCRNAWMQFLSRRDAVLCHSLISGRVAPIARLHPAIKGITDPGGQAEKGIVAFNKDKNAFDSYGKQQSLNAPVSVEEAAKYSNALNYLLNRRDRRFSLGNATVVFWAERPTLLEEVADAFWGDYTPPKPDAPPEDQRRAEQVRRFLSQLRSGYADSEAIDPDSEIGFYILGLSPNASRISVRFWEQSTVGQLKARLARHMKDVDIVGLNPDPPLSLRRMVGATARVIQGEFDYSTVPQNLSGSLSRAFLSGSRYPRQLLSTTLQRIASEGRIDPTRAAVLKAFLLREEVTTMDPYLNKEHPSSAYHCGRMLAVLAFAQEKALRAVNSGVIRRTLGSVMASPGLQLGRLQRAAEVGHIPKLQRDLPSFVRDELKFINSALRDDVPVSLRQHDQAIFMLGFYQELQYLDFNGAQVEGGRRVRTEQGEWVRSKGEARVAELLTKLGLKYIYEPRAELPSGPERWPDFVVRGKQKKDDIYVEYLGMDTPEYNGRWEQKLQAYQDFDVTEIGGSRGRLIVLDARQNRLDHVAMLDLLRPILNISNDVFDAIKSNTEGDGHE